MNPGFDTGQTPNKEATFTTLNPYEFPRKIWTYIESSFTKHNVQVVEMFPQTPLKGNAVAWRIIQRIPGAGRDGKFHSRGPGLSNFLKVTPDGYIFQEYTQEMAIELEFAVYSDSSIKADQIAWELENAILETEGLLKEEDPGITLTFIMQTADMNMLFAHQDEIIVRSLRFRASLPVRRPVVVPELRAITRQLSSRDLAMRGSRVTRSSSEIRYDIPVDSNQRVMNILNVFIYDGESGVGDLLYRNLDYIVKKNLQNNVVYIEWEDENGRTPAVGDDFRVEYVVATMLPINDIVKPL